MMLISNELKSIIDRQGQGNQANRGSSQNMSNRDILRTYIKRRTVGIVYMVIVLMLLLTSSFFTDTGLNIGQLIFDYVGKFFS